MDITFSFVKNPFAYRALGPAPYVLDRMDDIEKSQDNNKDEAERLEKEKDIEQERVEEKERADREKTL